MRKNQQQNCTLELKEKIGVNRKCNKTGKKLKGIVSDSSKIKFPVFISGHYSFYPFFFLYHVILLCNLNIP